MTGVLLALTAIAAYLLGGVNGAIITSKIFYKRDVREYGSGNAGLTNYLRTFGPSSVVLLLGIDILKSVLAISIGGWLMHFVDARMLGKLFAGFCLVLGHMYPVYYHFHGGKGVLCTCVLAFMVDWRVGAICLGSFLVIVALTRYVSLGSIIGALLMPVVVWALGIGTLEGVLALMTALMIVIKHAENIQRLLRGTENKLSFHGSAKKRDST